MPKGLCVSDQPTLEVLITEDNQSTALTLDAVADSATGETVGDTSHFRSTTTVKANSAFEGHIKSLRIGSREYKQAKISYPGTNK